jgi:hypothetical protein
VLQSWEGKSRNSWKFEDRRLMVWKNGLKKGVKETEDPVCRVVEEYVPNEKGLAGLDGYNEVKSEVYQGMKETFNPYMDMERE